MGECTGARDWSWTACAAGPTPCRRASPCHGQSGWGRQTAGTRRQMTSVPQCLNALGLAGTDGLPAASRRVAPLPRRRYLPRLAAQAPGDRWQAEGLAQEAEVSLARALSDREGACGASGGGCSRRGCTRGGALSPALARAPSQAPAGAGPAGGDNREYWLLAVSYPCQPGIGAGDDGRSSRPNPGREGGCTPTRADCWLLIASPLSPIIVVPQV